MTESNKKWVDVVAKLTRLTQEGNLDWRPRTTEADKSSRDNVSAAFYAAYKGPEMRVVKRRRKAESFAAFAASVLGEATEYVVLELVDPDGLLIWSFPNVEGIDDLYRAIQYQIAGVDEMLNDFLRD